MSNVVEAIDTNEVALQQDDFHSICKEFHITPELDVCATDKNTKCKNFINKETDALTVDWTVDGKVVDVYCNPPAGHRKGESTGMKNFVIKAHEQWEKHNMRIIMMVTNACYGAKYFWECVQKYNKAFGDECVQIESLIHRPKMLNQMGKIEGCANKGIIVIVFNKHMGDTNHLKKSKVVSKWQS